MTTPPRTTACNITRISPHTKICKRTQKNVVVYGRARETGQRECVGADKQGARACVDMQCHVGRVHMPRCTGMRRGHGAIMYLNSGQVREAALKDAIHQPHRAHSFACLIITARGLLGCHACTTATGPTSRLLPLDSPYTLSLGFSKRLHTGARN